MNPAPDIANPAAKPLFVCHSSRDRVTALEIVRELETTGIDCWIAPRDAMPGIPYGEQIVVAVEHASIVLLVFSESSDHSRAVLSEIELAANRNKMILPVRIADIPPSPGLEYYIRSIQWHDAFEPDRDAKIAQLVTRVTELLRDGDTEREPHARAPAAAILNAFPDAELLRTQTELTQYIGPIARILVARAAQKARTTVELYDLLAEEIDDPAERQRFRDGCNRH